MPPAQADQPFAPQLDVAARSAAGVPGALLENQDNFLLIDTAGRACFLRDQREQRSQVAGWEPGHARLAVLDGMGGHGHGREAAEAAVAGLLAMPPCGTAAELAVRLEELHAQLQQQFRTDPGPRPGTTLTLLEIRPEQPALLYHVGDSRLYQVEGDRIEPLTVDHVPATAFAMRGMMDEQEWWAQVHGEHRPQISQAFILGDAISDLTQLSDPLFPLTADVLPAFLRHLPDRRPLELVAGRTYILATDGFWACAEANRWVARWPGILAGATSAQAMVDALFREIDEHPPGQLHKDNLTAIVIRPGARATDLTAVPHGPADFPTAR